jgi:hypothetical protein
VIDLEKTNLSNYFLFFIIVFAFVSVSINTIDRKELNKKLTELNKRVLVLEAKRPILDTTDCK